MYVNEIIEDYIKCSDDKPCYDCKAYEKIGDSSCTYCSLLTHYRDRLKDKIDEVIEKN